MVWVVFFGVFSGFLSYMYAILMCERENFLLKKVKNGFMKMVLLDSSTDVLTARVI